MFVRIYKVKLSDTSRPFTSPYKCNGELVINTSQIVSINKFSSSHKLTKEAEEKYIKIFDTTDLSIFDITLSTGKNYLIIGPTKAYDNIK